MKTETFKVYQVFDERNLIKQLLILVLPVPAKFVLGDRRCLQCSNLSEVRMLNCLFYSNPLSWAKC